MRSRTESMPRLNGTVAVALHPRELPCLPSSGEPAGTFRLMAGLFLILVLGGRCGSSGMDAFRHGDYIEALREFKNERDQKEDFAIGVMPYKGEGGPVTQMRLLPGSGMRPKADTLAPSTTCVSFYLRGEGVAKDREGLLAGSGWPPDWFSSMPRFILGGCTPGGGRSGKRPERGVRLALQGRRSRIYPGEGSPETINSEQLGAIVKNLNAAI